MQLPRPYAQDAPEISSREILASSEGRPLTSTLECIHRTMQLKLPFIVYKCARTARVHRG